MNSIVYFTGPSYELKFGLLNINSILTCNARINKREHVFSLLATHNLDVFCIDETYFTSLNSTRETMNYYVKPGYKMLTYRRQIAEKGQRKGGGVAILYRDHLNLQQLEIPHMEIQPAELEMVVNGVFDKCFEGVTVQLTETSETIHHKVDSCRFVQTAGADLNT